MHRRRMFLVRLSAALAVLLLLTAALLGAGWLVVRRDRQLPHVPTYGALLIPFGREVSYQDCGFHTGQDWFAPQGTPVFAVADGTVLYVGALWYGTSAAGRGPNAIVIDHGTWYSTYSHNERADVIVGGWVKRGQRIASVGNLGYSKVPHLHLEFVDKQLAPWTGDWQLPFAGCDGYVDPGADWGCF